MEPRASDAAAFYDVYRRGRDEFAAWLRAGAGQELRDALAAGGSGV